MLGSARVAVSNGLVAIGAATLLLLVVCAFLARSSVPPMSSQGTVPIAAFLAVAVLGQMLAVQQGGVDRSVAGAISLAAVTELPDQANTLLLRGDVLHPRQATDPGRSAQKGRSSC